MTARSGRLWSGLLLVSFLCGFAMAGTTGKIAGRVTDKVTGEGLPGVNVVLLGTNTGATSDPDGYYTIINVSPGTFDITASMVGYTRTTIQGIKVNIDRTATQNISMSQQAIQGQTVTIMAERPILERDRTSTASYTDAETIEGMPVTSMAEVVQLQAGVVTGEDGEMHFRGGRQREVAYLVDGVPVTNAYSQSGGQNVTVENAFIKELQVISGTFNAEYGSAQSGVVNIVTKNPEDKVHANLQMYMGDHISNNTHTFIGINQVNPLAESDIQATLSGPLLFKKLGFLANVRYNNSESYYWYERRFTAVDGWKINAYKRWFRDHYANETAQYAEVPIPDSLRSGDGKTGPLAQYSHLTFSGKLAYTLSNAISLSYSLFSTFDQSDGSGLAKRYQPDAGSISRNYTTSHILTFRHMISQNLFYNLHASYQQQWGKSYYREDNKIAGYPGDSGIQPIYSTAHGFSLGSTDGGYYGKAGKGYTKLYMASGDINWQIDRRNLVKFGFEFKQHEINTYSFPLVETEEWQRYQYTTAIRGASLTWDDYWKKMVDYWSKWDETYGTTKFRYPRQDEITRYRDYTIRPAEGALYIQDKLEMGEIILNAGVRLDAFKANEKYILNKRAESYNLGNAANLKEAPIQYQLSPRLGFSFPISEEGAFHVAYGHFFQVPSFSTMFSEPLRVLAPLQLQDSRMGNCTLKPERTISYEVGLQQGFASMFNADLTLFYKDFRNQLGIEAITTVDAIGYTRYVNRDYGNVKGITLALEKLARGLLTYSIDYTFQYAEGSASDPNFIQLVQAASRLGADPVQFVERQILPLDWDQRHTLNTSAILSLPNKWIFSVIGSLGSGLPFTPASVGDVLFPDREFKNTARRPLRWTVDLKAKKRVQFGTWRGMLFINVENVFDQLNHNRVYETTGLASQNAMLPEQRKIRDAQLAQEGIFTPFEIENRPEWYSSPRKVQIGMGIQF
jgi:outer membrane receptor protein involved in Fe transport